MPSSGLTLVWGEVNVITTFAFLTQFATLVVFLVRTSDRAILALDKARKALEENQAQNEAILKLEGMRKELDEAHACAKACKGQITILAEAFALYREMIAREYITAAALERSEARLSKSIGELGGHIEKLINNRGPVHG